MALVTYVSTEDIVRAETNDDIYALYETDDPAQFQALLQVLVVQGAALLRTLERQATINFQSSSMTEPGEFEVTPQRTVSLINAIASFYDRGDISQQETFAFYTIQAQGFEFTASDVHAFRQQASLVFTSINAKASELINEILTLTPESVIGFSVKEHFLAGLQEVSVPLSATVLRLLGATSES